MIKAIFFDIDGTLLSHASGGVPGSARTALRLLRQRGVKLFLATGRHILEIHRLPVGRLPFDGYVTLNGQICLDEREALLFDAPFEPADAQRMVSLFRQKAFPAMLVERDRLYINYVDEAVRLAQEAIETPIPQLGDYAGGSLYQFIVYGGEDRAAALLEQLPGCKMSRWNACAVDILPKSGGKALGIQRLLDHFRLESHEVMAFGDGENDIDMLRWAGVGVAMGNAGSQVREAADYVTADIDQDGVYRALCHYGLIENSPLFPGK